MSRESSRFLRLKLTALHERTNGLIIEARVLMAAVDALETRSLDGVERDASDAATRAARAAVPDVDALETASQVLADLRLAAEENGDDSDGSGLRDALTRIGFQLKGLSPGGRPPEKLRPAIEAAGRNPDVSGFPSPAGRGTG